MMMGPKKKPMFLMLLKKKMMEQDDDYGYDMDDDMMEDEPGGFEREGMRIAAADLIEGIRSRNEIQVMSALESFVKACK